MEPREGSPSPSSLVVVAIIGLFVLVTIPAMGNYIRAARVRASNDGIVADLRAVRYIAITNRTTATLNLRSSRPHLVLHRHPRRDRYADSGARGHAWPSLKYSYLSGSSSDDSGRDVQVGWFAQHARR